MFLRKVNTLPISLYARANRYGLLNNIVCENIFMKLYFMYKKYLEDPIDKFAGRYPHTMSNGHILDIGANIGYTACVFANKLSNGFRVFAFEPEPNNFRMLKKAIGGELSRKKVEVYNCAIGDVDGEMELWVNKESHGDCKIVTSTLEKSLGDRERKVVVPTMRIDSFIERQATDFKVSLVKIDVQGFEVAVARGMHGLLEKYQDVNLIVEFCPSEIRKLGFNHEELISIFNDRGYKPHVLHHDGLVTPIEYMPLLEVMDDEHYCDLFLSQNKYNN
jgi:FkbM family methyltransferase